MEGPLEITLWSNKMTFVGGLAQAGFMPGLRDGVRQVWLAVGFSRTQVASTMSFEARMVCQSLLARLRSNDAFLTTNLLASITGSKILRVDSALRYPVSSAHNAFRSIFVYFLDSIVGGTLLDHLGRSLSVVSLAEL